MNERLKRLIPLPVKRALHAWLFAAEMPLPAAPRALVFLAADYGNIGDLAITAAQQHLLRVVLPGRSVVAVPISSTRQVLRSLRRRVVPGDLVTIIGGGNMGSLYPEIEELRQRVIRAFPCNRIVCFPQTLDWDERAASKRALARIVRVYARHPDLHLFARESVSHGKLRALFAGHASVRVGLAPDVVLSATADALGAAPGAEPHGALLCLRDDGERSLRAQDDAALRQALAQAGLDVRVTDTHAGGAALSAEHCRRLLAGKIEQFAAARLVVTDRLHGMILALLAGTPCLVLPNANHKIRQTWVDWLADVPQLRFLDVSEIAAADAALRQLLATPRRDPAMPLVDPQHFAALRAALEAS